MKTSISSIAKALMLLPLSIAATTVAAQTLAPQGTLIKPTDPHIQYTGRISFRTPESPTFTYPGVEICAAFEGTSLRVAAKPMSGYFMAQIDNGAPFKVGFNAPRDSIISLATALPRGNHLVRLTYVIEGYQRMPEFRGFLLDAGCRLTDAPVQPKRKIEFIGDSMTCGYGVESTDGEAPYMDETENYYYTYAARTARALRAQQLVVARSGIGIYRNYSGPATGSTDNLPSIYERTLLNNPNEKWLPAKFVPDVVCVNLGTNDVSTDTYDRNYLQTAFRNFLQTLRARYPQAKIVFISGSMLTGRRLEHLQDAMDTVVREARLNKNDKNVFRFDFSTQTGELGMGANGHPSLWQHEKMANELTSYLRGLMQWF